MVVTDRYGTVWSIHVWHAPRDIEFEQLPAKEQRQLPDRRPLTRATLHLGDCGAKRGVPCNIKDGFVAEARRGERDFYKPQIGAKVALARTMKMASLGPFTEKETPEAVKKAEEIRTDLWRGYVKGAHLIREVPEFKVLDSMEGTEPDVVMKHYIGPFATQALAEVAIRKLQKLSKRRSRRRLESPIVFRT